MIFGLFAIIVYMAEYILTRKTRNIASSAVHVLLNLVFGVGTVLLTLYTSSPVLGLILVAISKWRVFAVRSRYIWLNFKSNLLDFIVGVSVVLITYYSGNVLVLDILLAIFYCVWLIVIKPLTSEIGTLSQALIAVFLGMSSSAIISAGSDPLAIVVMAFIVGYSASRHIISQSESKGYGLLTLVCGLIFAEIAWLCQAWMIVYTFGKTGIRVPQVAIILTLFTFLFYNVHLAAIKRDGEVKMSDIMAPLIFSAVITAVIVLWFSSPIFNI